MTRIPFWLWLVATVSLADKAALAQDNQCFTSNASPAENHSACCSGQNTGKGAIDGIKFNYQCDAFPHPTNLRPAGPAPSMQHCATLCAKDAECVAGAWNHVQASCYLTHTKAGIGRQEGWVLLEKDTCSGSDCEDQVHAAVQGCKATEAECQVQKKACEASNAQCQQQAQSSSNDMESELSQQLELCESDNAVCRDEHEKCSAEKDSLEQEMKVQCDVEKAKQEKDCAAKIQKLQQEKDSTIVQCQQQNNDIRDNLNDELNKCRASIASAPATPESKSRGRWEANRLLKGHASGATLVEFSLDGTQLASVFYDHTIGLWDVAQGELLHVLKGHQATINAIAFSPDGKRLASGSSDERVTLWDTSRRVPPHAFEGHRDPVKDVVFSPDGKQLASASNDKTVKIWDVATRELLHTLDHTEDEAVMSVAFSPDGKLLASGTYRGPVRLWDTVRGELLHIFEGHTSLIHKVIFSPDGKKLASGANDIRLWDVTYLHELWAHQIPGGLANSRTITFSRDGAQLASGHDDNIVRLWDVARGLLLNTHERYSRASYYGDRIAFSPDGKQVVSTGDAVAIWDTTYGSLVGAHEDYGHPNDVAFSPSGDLIASGSDKGVGFWTRV